ncbi:MAG: nucleotidyltransferase domain-containing protein [Desulfobacteraceae bacterium]|nr:nucleotidyltransferase domain-containing protein [Desulfobacteraceae bacterium]MBU4053094.1 nucleotidyltransferase domain-containing protein [Pseudomonadota bacterium]
MALGKNTSLKKAKQFLNLLKQEGMDVSEAYLFGSVVNGLAGKDSDIDVAVVSKDFQGVPYYDMKKISKHRRKVDLRLEIHPFSLDEVETDPPQFFIKIKQEGLRI